MDVFIVFIDEDDDGNPEVHKVFASEVDADRCVREIIGKHRRQHRKMPVVWWDEYQVGGKYNGL